MFSIVGFLAAAYFRITFDSPMWVMEAPALQAVRRISEGQPLYAPPTLEYVAPLYAPLYFYAAAAVSTVIGVGLPALRLVAVVASSCSALLIAHLVWRETRNLLVSIVAAGLFIASTALSAFALDLARVDALCLVMLLAAVAAGRAAESDNRRGMWFQLASGVFTGLGVLSKQTAFVMIFPLLINSLFTTRVRGALLFMLGTGMTLGLAAFVLWRQYGEWTEFYLLQLPSNHSLTLDSAGNFWTQKILSSFLIPLGFAPVFFIGRSLDRDFAPVRFWLLVSAGMIGMAWAATLNFWSDDNVLLPALAVLSILFGLGFAEALRRLDGSSRQARAFRVYIVALAAAQFVVVHYNPRSTSPLRSDVSAAERSVTLLTNLPGQVYGPDYAEFLYAAGKGEQASGLSVFELVGGFGGRPLAAWPSWLNAYTAALDRRQFDELVLDPQSVEFFLETEASRHGYVDTGPLVQPGDELNVWGSRYTPRPHVWVPRERAPAAQSGPEQLAE
jgi:4-amino-4-deoxy-L-arabinose transferase-like glycosyltransferase